MVSRTLSGFKGRSLCLLGVVLLPVLEVKQDLGIVLLLPTGGVVVALKGEDGEWLDTGSRAILPPGEHRCVFAKLYDTKKDSAGVSKSRYFRISILINSNFSRFYKKNGSIL